MKDIESPDPSSGRGVLLPFDAYLTATAQPRQSCVLWPWSELSEKTTLANHHGERGTVALVAGSDSAEVAPGLSMTVQVVVPGARTASHKHSFWHLYVVKSGGGSCRLGGDVQQALAAGDVLYVPAWSPHSFENECADEPLVLIALQNLPQLAALGTLIRESEAGLVTHVYRKSSPIGEAALRAIPSHELRRVVIERLEGQESL